MKPLAGEAPPAVRRARPEDARAIAAIHVRSWRATYAAILPADALRSLDVDHRATVWTQRLERPAPGHMTLVANLGAQLVGFLLLGPTPDPDSDPATTGQVLAVHVDPDATGRGAGGALLGRAVDELAGCGYALGTLWVVSDNQRARAFYERAGWTPDGSSRREPLAVEGEVGPDVTVVRYRLPLHRPAGA